MTSACSSRTCSVRQSPCTQSFHSLHTDMSAPLPGTVSDFLAYLQDSELVARFQRRCGLHLVHTRHGSNQDLYRDQDQDQDQGARGEARGARQRFDNSRNGKCVMDQHSPEYEVRRPLLHLLFLFSSALGSEVFYISVPPWLHWNLDPFLCRRLVNMWTLVMYVGQLLKDLLKLPRPSSPPVVKLEDRDEYGLPSTHAMAATGISFTLLLSAPTRIQFPFAVGLLMALTFSSLVCLSRIYTGMHSVLDVICGIFISSLLLFVTFPFWDSVDHFQLSSPLSPAFGLGLSLLLCYTYPSLDHYSSTRGDTTTVLGCFTGCWLGYWLNAQLGETFEPKTELLPVALPQITTVSFAFGTLRFVLGVMALVGTRQTVKYLSLKVLYWRYKVPEWDVNARKRREIEVPYRLVTYTCVGLVNSILVNRGFVYMGLL